MTKVEIELNGLPYVMKPDALPNRPMVLCWLLKATRWYLPLL